MRSLLISVLALVILTGGWLCFYQYTATILQQIVSVCEQDVMQAIEEERWDDAYDVFDDQYQAWQRYQNLGLLMLETEKINTIDMNFVKTLMYMEAKDVSNSSGELFALTKAIALLYENESLKWSNIL